MKENIGENKLPKKDGEDSPNSEIGRSRPPKMDGDSPSNLSLKAGKFVPGSSASGMPGAARFGDPEIYENSVESEVYCDSSERIQSLENDPKAIEKRNKFNQAAFALDHVRDEAERREKSEITFNAAETEVSDDDGY